MDRCCCCFFQGEGGKHRALLIGINYTGGKGELKGCHNDVAQMKEYIVEHVSYSSDMCVSLCVVVKCVLT